MTPMGGGGLMKKRDINMTMLNKFHTWGILNTEWCIWLYAQNKYAPSWESDIHIIHDQLHTGKK